MDFAERPKWQADAACRGMDQTMFFPERGDNLAEAKAVCASCPVRVECKSYAERQDEHFGIWGGQSFGRHGRRQMAKREAA